MKTGPTPIGEENHRENLWTPKSCPACGGSGKREIGPALRAELREADRQQGHPDGFPEIDAQCSACDGTGVFRYPLSEVRFGRLWTHYRKYPCETCAGDGRSAFGRRSDERYVCRACDGKGFTQTTYMTLFVARESTNDPVAEKLEREAAEIGALTGHIPEALIARAQAFHGAAALCRFEGRAKVVYVSLEPGEEEDFTKNIAARFSTNEMLHHWFAEHVQKQVNRNERQSSTRDADEFLDGRFQPVST